MMWLLDTNVVSELRKVRSGKADPNVSRWAERVEASELYLSVDEVLARQAARLHVPDPRPVRDAMIAATAQVYTSAAAVGSGQWAVGRWSVCSLHFASPPTLCRGKGDWSANGSAK